MKNIKSKTIMEKDKYQDIVTLFWQSIPPVWHCARSLMHQVAVEKFKIPVSQFHILRRLNDGNGSVSELSDCMHLSRSNISRSVDELVKAGYIKREHDQDDRRNINLTMTHEGAVLIRNMLDETGFKIKEKFEGLSSDEYHEVSRGLVLLGNVFMKREAD